MKAVLVLIFLGFAAIAAGFVVWPILRRREDVLRGRAVLAAAAAFLVLGVGGGVYLILGSPQVALRSLTGASVTDLPGLVTELVSRVRNDPQDLTAWTLLGRGYLTLGDPGDAAAAFKRAVPLAPANQQAALLADYGEALTMANSGAVPPDAETAFQAALTADPKNEPARFYLGLAYAGRRETAKALDLWEGMLKDAPADAPWRRMVEAHVAALKGQTGQGQTGGTAGAAPDVGAMVARLAARLKTQPNDPEGWQMLIRSYSMLGETDKARATLADARAALKADGAALPALEAEARSLGLEK